MIRESAARAKAGKVVEDQAFMKDVTGKKFDDLVTEAESKK